MPARPTSNTASGVSEFYSDYSNTDNQITASLIDRIRQQRGKKELDISLCNIYRVPLDAINMNYGEVTTLDLSFNKISSLHKRFVAEMGNLTRLDLSRNQLKMLPDTFGNLTQLVYLDVHINKLRSLPLSMGKMERLVYLNLEKNQFRPPLDAFLESERVRTNMSCSANAVIKFLAKLTKETLACGDYEPYFTVEADGDDNKEDAPMTADDMDHENNPEGKLEPPVKRSATAITPSLHLKKGEISTLALDVDKEKYWERVKSVVYGLLVLTLCIIFTPLMTSLLYDSSAMDHFAKSTPALNLVWQSLEPFHEWYENFFKKYRLPSVFSTKGPNELEGVGRFMAIYIAFRDALIDMLYHAGYLLSLIDTT